MKKSISLLLLSLLMITPSCQKPKEVTNEYNIVPQPNQLVPKEGRFELSNKVRLVVPSDAPEVKKVADGFAEQLKQTAGISLKEAESVDGKPAISFVLQEGMPKEGYKLSVTPTLITVTASQPNGFFYGVQTIYQLLPPAVYGKELKKKADWSVPAVEIEDAPPLCTSRTDAGRLPPLRPDRVYLQVYRPVGNEQDERFPLASDGRSGMENRNQEISETDRDRFQT